MISACIVLEVSVQVGELLCPAAWQANWADCVPARHALSEQGRIFVNTFTRHDTSVILLMGIPSKMRLLGGQIVDRIWFRDMAKPEQQAVTINVAMPVNGYRRRMFFNRFYLENIGEHVLAHFGLIDNSGFLRDVFLCALTKQSLADNKPGLTSLLTKVGGPQNVAPKWGGVSSSQTGVEMANVMNVVMSVDGELLLASFPITPAMAQSKNSNAPVQIDGVAILRTDPDLLKQFIAELYQNR